MIWEDIKEFERLLKNETGVNTHIGVKDFAPREYPIVQIFFEDPFIPFIHNTESMTLDIPLSLKIITDKKEEHKAFNILYKLLKKLNTIQDNKGDSIQEDIIPVYTENTFEITIKYNLKNIIQNS